LSLQRYSDCPTAGLPRIGGALTRRYTATDLLIGEASDQLQALLPLQGDKQKGRSLVENDLTLCCSAVAA
jgi:hypothetical protein